jgi:catechol O-methyltransferase
MLSAIDEFSEQKDFLISVGPHKTQVIVDILKKENPKVVVELGGYLGYSAILFADTLRAVFPEGEMFHVWSLEFEPRFAAIAEKLIDLAGLSAHVSIVVGPADQTLKRLHGTAELTHIDLLFLDHVEKLYKSDFVLCRSLGLLKEGAVAVADNVVIPGAPEYRDYVRSDPAFSSIGVRALIQPGDLEVRLMILRMKSVNELTMDYRMRWRLLISDR